jgi:3-oxosteroid 1-dehydrogenase
MDREERMPGQATYDVVVAGSGIAGLSAALAASRLGLTAIVLEKAEKLGGSTTYSYGLTWVGDNPLAKAAGYPDSLETILSYMRFLGGGEHSEERIIQFAHRSPEAIQFFADCGVRWKIAKGIKDFYIGRAPGTTSEGRTVEHELVKARELGRWADKIMLPPNAPYRVTGEELVAWGGIHNFAAWDAEIMQQRERDDVRGLGVGLICGFVKALAERNVTMQTDAAVEQLIVKDHRVVGVRLRNGHKIMARRGVVLAAGGYESNDELTRNFEGLPGCESKYLDTLTGDAMIMATEIGAAVRKIHNSFRVHLGFKVPGETRNGREAFRNASIIELCSPHTIVVNRDGRRFANEAYFQSMAPSLRVFDAQRRRFANLPCYLIFDQQYISRFSFGGSPPGSPLPASVSTGGSIGELADKLGIDPSGLEQSVARFNEFAKNGRDEDFQRGDELWRLAQESHDGDKRNPRLGQISQAPFCGIELNPSPAGSAGLHTNIDGQVIHQRGHPIAGLYSSGNSTVHTETGLGYQPGMTIAAAITFSYLAARHMSDVAVP